MKRIILEIMKTGSKTFVKIQAQSHTGYAFSPDNSRLFCAKDGFTLMSQSEPAIAGGASFYVRGNIKKKDGATLDFSGRIQSLTALMNAVRQYNAKGIAISEEKWEVLS